MPKTAELHPIDPSLTPIHEGEIVAFREDHADHPGMYGRIQQIGVDTTGKLTFDLEVYDPFDLKVVSDKPRRSSMEDIQ